MIQLSAPGRCIPTVSKRV